MTKITATKTGRMYEGILEKGKLSKVIKRPEVLLAKERELFVFEKDGLLVTIMFSDGQIINKRKAFNRFCESKGGYGAAMREQNMTNLADRPKVTKLDEEYKVIA